MLTKEQKKVYKQLKKKRTAAPKKNLVKVVKAVAKNEAEKLIETKYIANSTSTDNFQPSVKNTLVSKLDSSSGDFKFLQPVIPTLFQDVSTTGGIGSRIQLVSGKTDFLIRFKNDNDYSQNIIVKLFCLESRKAKNYDQMVDLPTGELLRTGANTTKDWAISTGIPEFNDMNPVNKAAWIVHAVKTFHLVKNAGYMNLNGEIDNQANTYGKTFHKFTWHWGKDKTLKYNDVNSNNFGRIPQNFAPCYGIVAYYPDGSRNEPGEGVADNQTMPVQCLARNHMYYKDA